MSKTNLIKKLEMERNSRVITYATSDRAPFATRIASDIIPLLGNQLDAIGKVKKSVFFFTPAEEICLHRFVLSN